MTRISIFGDGAMGKALDECFKKAGNTTEFIHRNDEVKDLGELVVLAVPYASVSEIIAKHQDKLNSKVIVDVTNPVNFETFDGLVVPPDSSGAAEIARELPGAKVLKAFNTTFAGVLTSGKVGGENTPRVLLAGDDAEAKKLLTKALEGSGLETVDVGSIKRARELEAIGLLNITLAAGEKISWSAGFHLFS